jgi:hypothetical protein
MNLPPRKVCRRIWKLLAQMGSTSKDAEVAQTKLNQLLAEHGLTWNDLPKILAAVDAADNRLRLVEEHVAATADKQLAVALWILHTHVFDRFSVTPRLALLSPVRGCGKTIVLSLIELLVPEGNRTDNVSAAAIYHQLKLRPRTALLVDEADGLDLCRSNVLRSVFNSGHRRGGAASRYVGGWPHRYPTFAPLAIAAIGTLPLPLLHRSIVINMERSSAQLRRLDEADPAFSWTRQAIREWAANVQLNKEPEIPPELRNRAADNWRVLFSIGDVFGYGGAARAAAVRHEDAGVLLLSDIQAIFEVRKADRLSSAVLEHDPEKWSPVFGKIVLQQNDRAG